MKIVKIWFLQKFKIILYAFVAALMSVTAVFATATISNLAVSNANPTAGSQITVSFDVTVNATGVVQFAVGFTKQSSMPQCGMDWVASGAGIYKTPGYYWYDPTTRTAATLLTATNVFGPNGTGGGLATDSITSGTTRNISVLVNVPPEYDGTYYASAVVYQHSNDLRWNCNSGTGSLNDDHKTTSFNVTGGSLPKLDLEFCRGNYDGVKMEFYYRMKNFSESGVTLNDLKMRTYFYDSYSSWWESGGIQKVYQADGTTTFGPDNNNLYSFTSTSADCADTGSYTRKANWIYERYFDITSGTGAYILLPPAGGFVTVAGSSSTILRRSNSTWMDPGASFPAGHDDDYSSLSAMTCTSCGSSNCTMQEYKYVTMYYKGALVCEWDSASAMDPETGEEPCGVNGCNLRIAKSASVALATIGDTITFCITVTSTAIADLETYVWDTMPDHTAYLDCDNSCSYDSTNKVVSWFLVLAPGYSATRCFRVTVASYPFIIREGEFFAGVDFRKLESYAGRRSVYGINEWKYWVTAANCSIAKN